MGAPVNLCDLEELARERLPAAAWAYYSGGSFDEHTLRDNEAAFARRRLRPRVLVDVASIDTATTVLGGPVALPIGIAPTAQHGLACPQAETATARAAAAGGVVYCASTMSTLPLEDIAAASIGGPRWFQLYIQNDRGATKELVARAAAAGYSALVLTVDTAVGGWRERDRRAEPAVQTFGNLGFAGSGDDLGAFVQGLFDASVTWDDILWLRSQCGLPVVLKGIVTAEDARLAVEHGAAAVWVSNHGGRQLDRAPATLDMLEEVVDAVDGRVEVYLDGGVRRGGDVALALALGARAVFLGRPILYALAYDGEAGVRLALDLVAAELRNTMALLGTPALASISRACVI